MAGPTGTEIGRVTVRVVPDTTGFDKKTEADLKRMLDDVTAYIDAKLKDSAKSDLKEDATAAAESVDAEVEVGMQLADGATAKLHAQMASGIEAIEAALDAVEVALDLNESDMMSDLAKLIALTEGLDPEIRIDTRMDLGDAMSELAALSTALALMHDTEIDIHVDTSGVVDAYGTLLYLRTLSRDIDIRVDVDDTTALRALGQGFIDVTDFDVEYDVTVRGATEALAELTAVRATAESMDAWDVEFTVDWDVDTAGAMAEMAAARAAAETMFSHIPVDFDIIAAGIARMAARARAARMAAEAAAGAIRLRIELDNDSFRRVAAQLRSTADGIANRVVMKVPLSVDGDQVRRQVASLIRDIERDFARLRTSNSPAFSRALTNSIDNNVRALARLEDAVDRNNQPGNRLTRTLSSIGNAAGQMLGKINLSGHSLLILAAIMAFAAPVLAIISGALITLPGLFAAVGVAGAAAALSWEGIKKAAEVLKDEFNELRETMTKAGQTEFGPVFGQLQDPKLWKMLNSSLPLVTRGLSDMAMGFAQAVTSKEGMANLDNTIQNVAKSLSMAQPGVTMFTNGLLNLVSKTSDRLPGLSNIFNKLGSNFENWINKITTVDSEGTTPLDRALSQTKEIAQGVAESIGNLFTKGFELLEKDELGDKIKQFFSEFDSFVNTTLPAMRDTFTGIVDAIQEIRDVWNGIEWVIDPMEKLTDKLLIDIGIKPLTDDDIKDAMPGPDIFKNIPVFREGAELGLALRERILKSLQEGGILDGVRDWWNGLDFGAIFSDWSTAQFGFDPVQALQGMFGWLQTADFSEIAGQVADALSDAIMNALTLGAWPAIQEFMDIDFSGLTDSFSTAMDNLPSIAETSLSILSEVFGSGIGDLLGQLATGGSDIGAEVSTWPGTITSAIGDLGGLLVEHGRALMAGLLAGIKASLGEVLSFAAGIAERIAAVKGPLPYDRIVLVANGEALMEGLGTGIENGLSPVLEMTSTIVDSIQTQLVESKGKLTAPATDLVDGIREAIGASGDVTINVNIGSINTSVVEQAANATVAANEKIAKSANSAAKAQEKVYGKLDTEGKKASDALSTQIDEIDYEIEKLEAIKDSTKSKATQKNLETKIKELEVQKKGLEYQKKAAEYENKYGESLESAVKATEAQTEAAKLTGKTLMEKIEAGIRKGETGVREAVDDIVDAIGEEFGQQDLSKTWAETWDDSEAKKLGTTITEENRDQFYSDLGISGSGAIPTAFEKIPQYIFNVNNMDEALSAKDRETNKNSLKYSNSRR